MLSANRRARIVAWIHPEGADPTGVGYQPKHGMWALGTGGWLGVGPGSSRQKWGYLTQADSDYIFAVLGEEFGGEAVFAGRQWVLDPIDGTKNYSRGVPAWATLIGLTVHGNEVVADLGQHRRRHAAPGDMSSGPASRSHCAREDEFLVAVELELVAQRREGSVVVRQVEEALDHGTLLPRADTIGVGALAEEQPQAGDDHRLACAGLAGQHRETAVELGGRRADRTERLDAYLGEHYWPRHPVTGNRNLRTSRSVKGALSRRIHFSDVPQRVTSRRAPAGTTISRRPSQNTIASCPPPSTSIAIEAYGLVTMGRANKA